ncbi:hypothetical protein [Oricola sp.]|uniref:hypothetical protein n=1 Tax=Oricola sp. TaxID=1979950 RepID=UPI003BA9A3F1
MADVRAKFWCKKIEYVHNPPGGDPAATMAEITFEPVYPQGEDDTTNKEWSRWTPSGEIKMTVTNPAAIARFEGGRSYYVDFTAAD